jgi:quercetin dioxygenase-like cupin family protein
VDDDELECQSLDELADAPEQHHQGPSAIELWQDYDPSQRFVAVFPVTEAQGAAASTVAYYVFDPGSHSGLHSDSAEEVIYIADGVGEVFVNGKQVKLEVGEFVVVNEGV